MTSLTNVSTTSLVNGTLPSLRGTPAGTHGEEALDSNDVLTSLWSPTAISKCRLGVADAILYENGLPIRWMVTGSNGDVREKRGLDARMIRRRWGQVYETLQPMYMAVIRQEGGVYKFLESGEAWDTFCHDWQKPLTGVCSLHNFLGSGIIKSNSHSNNGNNTNDGTMMNMDIETPEDLDIHGNPITTTKSSSSISPTRHKNGIIYRNTYRYNPETLRLTTSTYSYPIVSSHNNGNNNVSGPAGMTVLYESSLSLTESRATSINKVTDLATSTAVRYVEQNLGITITEMIVDYVVDCRSQIWVLWTTKTLFRRPGWSYVQKPISTNANNHVGSGLVDASRSFDSLKSTEKRRRRRPIVDEEERFRESEMVAEQVAGRVAVANTISTKQASNVMRGLELENSLHQSSLLATESLMSIGGGGGGSRFSETSGDFSFGVRHSTRDEIQFPPGPALEGLVTSPPAYPHAGRCCGDFCTINITSSGAFSSDGGPGSEHIVTKLFSAAELERLRRDPRMGKMCDLTIPNAGLNEISRRSIILSRREQRCFNNGKDGKKNGKDGNNGPVLDTWKAYPEGALPDTITAFQNKNDPQVGNGVNNNVASNDVITNNNRGSSVSKRYRSSSPGTRSRGDKPLVTALDADENASLENPSLFYERVKVCGVCYAVYRCLDWARELLNEREEKAKSASRRQRLNASQSLLSLAESESSIEDSSSATRPRTSVSGRGRRQGDEEKRFDSPTRTSAVRTAEGRSWKNFAQSESVDTSTSGKRSSRRKELAVLDNYMKGATSVAASAKAAMSNPDSAASIAGSNSKSAVPETNADLYLGHVVIAVSSATTYERIRETLGAAAFTTTWCRDGLEASNRVLGEYDKVDCLIVERTLRLVDAFEITKRVRSHERELRKIRAAADATKSGPGGWRDWERYTNQRLPVICYTDLTAPSDPSNLMRADMDGCLSDPIDSTALLQTIRAAVPQHLAPRYDHAPPTEEELWEKKHGKKRILKVGALGQMEGSSDSSSMALRTLAMSTPLDQGSEVRGVCQIDADTRIPFLILKGSTHSRAANSSNNSRLFNLIVCHDLFDTLERAAIFLRPLVAKYPALKVLVWNYPGQDSTDFRSTQALTNEFISSCMSRLLGQIGNVESGGSGDFDTSHPCYLLGFGYGANIATHFLAHYRLDGVRGLLSVNGWSFVDSHLAGVLHDCVNVFESTPDDRPDLPVYFFSRFMFAPSYLARVSVPLALNLYTAVHNGISMAGRIALCRGVLRSVDLRKLLPAIDIPIICMHANQNEFARPAHVEPFVKTRGNGVESRSIRSALQGSDHTAVVWFQGGHEVAQENRRQLSLLLEQIVTGYHEVYEVTFPSAAAMMLDAQYKPIASGVNTEGVGNGENQTMEDRYAKSVLDFAKKTTTLQRKPGTAGTNLNDTNEPESFSMTVTSEIHDRSSIDANATANERNAATGDWNAYEQAILARQHASNTKPNTPHASKSSNTFSQTVTTTNPNERAPRDKLRGSVVEELSYLLDAQALPEVREYMSWRLKRNRKRLQRLQLAAQTIQTAYRAYLARHFVRILRRKRAAITIQRAFRGWLGRRKFFNQVRKVWGVLNIQRCWRGYSVRLWYFALRVKIAAAVMIQRMWRGLLGRRRVARIREIRNQAACIIQAMMRRFQARKVAWLRRHFRNCAITIQRIYRGLLGRRRAAAERDKYIFSRSQAAGLEFGRQMLLEHKLHVTRLQSEVSLLTQDKVAAEESIESILEEVAAFEEAVRSLEKEMHSLARIEAEAAAFMDSDSRLELREQKIRLDHEFGEMLSKISTRKDQLGGLEQRLAAIDAARQGKEEDLRTLERKLVVLLEDQQKEMEAIARKQEVRGAMLAASHSEIVRATTSHGGMSGGGSVHSSGDSLSGNSRALITTGNNAAGGGVVMSGPSIKEKRQAAQLMQSTETMMKFGFMSMSMTYFSSLNMIKALRTVSAQDTVMAALADSAAQRAAGGPAIAPNGDAVPMNPVSSLLQAREDGSTGLRPGMLPGQQALRVSSWSVTDVGRWLQTLSLGQYVEAFADAAIDGEFLFDLTDDDLRNTLAIEHRLHRKKILSCVARLKMAEAQNEARMGSLQAMALSAPHTADPQSVLQDHINTSLGPSFTDSITNPDHDDRLITGPTVTIEEIFSFVRHSKLSQLKDAIDYLPPKTFDNSLVQSQYIQQHGTSYVSGYDRLIYHVNKVDSNGNTLLSIACQNGNMKIAKYLLGKGANPNHQNNAGQTPAHFAIAFRFFDLSQYLFENGADDTIVNMYGLSPYDGLTTDDGTIE